MIKIDKARVSIDERRAFVHALPIGAYWLLEFDHYAEGRNHALRQRLAGSQDRCVVGHEGKARAETAEPIEKIVYTEGWAHEVDPAVFPGIEMLLIQGKPVAARDLAKRSIIRTMSWEGPTR